MKKSTITNSGKLALAVAGLSMVLAGTARADCGISVNRFANPMSSVAAMPGAGKAFTTNALPRSEYGLALSIVGLWETTFTSDGQVVDQGFDLWNSDGTEVLNDDPAPATGNVCLGVYVKSGPATYKLKHPSWTFDANGNLTGTAIIREQVTVEPGGNTYKGTFTIDLYDVPGNHLAQFTGTISAQRMTVDF